MKRLLLASLLLFAVSAHASLIASFGGNSDGQLLDQMGGSPLTIVPSGAVINPSSPTPPEGDRWLGGDFVDSGACFLVPSDAYPNSTSGRIGFYINTARFCCCGSAAQEYFLNVGNGATNFLTFNDYCGSILTFSYATGGSAQSLTYSYSWTANATYKIEAAWNSGGVTLYLNGTAVASSSTPAAFSGVTTFTIGAGNASNVYPTLSYIDNVQIFSSSSDTYPVTFGTPTVTPTSAPPTATFTSTPTITPTPTATAACNYFNLTPVTTSCTGYGTCPQSWEGYPDGYETMYDLPEASILYEPADSTAPYKCAFSFSGGIGTATSLDGIVWVKRVDNPVLPAASAPQPFEGRVSLAKNHAGTYIIYFSASSLEREITTSDFAGTWTYQSTPVIPSGSIPDDAGAENSTVWFDPSTTGTAYMIWEHVCMAPGPGGSFQLELLTSTDDGATFGTVAGAPHPLLDLSQNIGGAQANAPSRIYRDSNGCFNMLYTSNGRGSAQTGDVYWAQSCNFMRNWTVSSVPIIKHLGNCYGITNCDQAGDPEWWQAADGNTYIQYAVASNASGGGTGVLVKYAGPACQFFTCSGNLCTSPTPMPTATITPTLTPTRAPTPCCTPGGDTYIPIYRRRR